MWHILDGVRVARVEGPGDDVRGVLHPVQAPVNNPVLAKTPEPRLTRSRRATAS